MERELKNWLVPCVSFFLFLYALALLGVYTYRDSKAPLFEGVQNSGTTSVGDFKKELNKYIN